MKKTLFAAFALTLMAGCSSEEILEVAQKEAITFDNAFVDKATRAIDDSYNNNGNFTSFEVYGTISGSGNNEGTANIFNQEKVTKGGKGIGDSWTYDASNTQYWISGNIYNFRAVADGNIDGVTSVTVDDNKMPTAINLLDASQQKDILYDASETINYTSGAKTVSFTFAHLLAKAKFTVKNTITTDNGYSYKVSNITIKGADKNGIYTIADEAWSAPAEPATYDLSFGYAVAADAQTAATEATDIAYNSSMVSNYERLLIPSNKAIEVNFDYQLLKDGAVIDTQNKTINTNAINLVAGQAYNFIISLGNPGEPIKFDVTKVNDWSPANGTDTNI